VVNFNNLYEQSISIKLLGPPTPLPPEPYDWSVVHQAVLDQYELLDGDVDGIIEDPDLDNSPPEDIICAA